MVERVRTIHQILAELEILSEVSANQHHDKIHGGTPNRAPKGPKQGLADQHRQAYQQANGPGQRARALAAAEHELENAKRQRLLTKEERANHPPISSPQWKRHIAESPEPDGKIATEFGVSRQYIRQIRAGYGDPPL